ncbi:response receiver [Phytophthora cinnamomi]|uniref:response receiver n=1 Tax=Phytophthora cinnamomi TaxID=4785 RepID=UPI00355A2B76|nr:response receiver [Phytophthora cinnamomi]
MAPPMLTIKADASTRVRSFPTPFKCSGDFCGFAMQLSLASVNSHHAKGRRAAAAPPQALAASALSLLFTKEELRALGDANLSRLLAAMEVAQSAGKSIDGKQLEAGELRVITYKSIALGRGNREHLQNAIQASSHLVTGFHELNDVPHGTSRKQQELSPTKYKSRCEDEQPQRGPPDNQSKSKAKPQRNFEDAFIDRVLTTVKEVVPTNANGTTARPQSSHQKPLDGAQWRNHQQHIVQQAEAESSGVVKAQAAASSASNQHGASKPSKLMKLTNWDPTTPAFERISANVVYQPGAGSKIYPLLPEVKEYMGWRVRRNQKRLQRMAAMARVIQRAFRAFYARTLTRRLYRERCAIHMQRLWRARVARKRYKGLKREDWAVRLLQRHWRGKMGRTSYKQRMLEYLSALDIQRITRGWLARGKVMRRRQQIHQAAVRIQQLMRRYVACRKLFRQRLQRNAAMKIQRVFRGLLGRRRFDREREKFLFSKTQSQGLTFGKQLLLEYKLYGTKLQSDVALLAREKSDVEAQAEKLVKEICEFDEGVRLLEAELLALGKAETDNNAPGGANRTLDETAKWALREQKMRLDREFTQMLAQIAQRREKLGTLEETLARVDQERLRKEEELKALERKLVLLLEEQQKELARIRAKQETRSQLALDLIPPGSVLTGPGTGISSAMSPGPGSVFASSPVAGGPTTFSPTSSALGPGSGFPSHSSGAIGARVPGPAGTQGFSQQQRQEAASLMESTETMMKFGFMSMSMTYFSSMNMVRAMRKIGAHHLTLDSAAAVSQHRWPENSAAEMPSKAAASIGGLATMSPAGFQPSIPAGGFPGQQPLQVAAWSVSDVGRWLDTLALAQYKRAFADATVDGALLLHLTDDDLRNTLGMEHHLHRKKVLTTVEEMRVRERNQMRQLFGDNIGSTAAGPAISDAVSIPSSSPARPMAPASTASPVNVVANPVPASSVGPAPSSSEAPPGGGRVVVSFSEFCSLVRHGKVKQVREALQNVVERKFDPLTIKTQFAPGTGTVYNDQLEKSVFHINKGDDNGNSPLLLAAQNNHLKVAQLLLSKGANPDHQNSRGHTAGHYAMAYSFFDLGAWLLDPDKGGGRDDILNENGLSAYDGLD